MLQMREVPVNLGVAFYVCNFKDFGRIIDYFVDEYEQGRTLNPCAVQRLVEIRKLHEYAKSIGAEAVASGHYARSRNSSLTAPRHCTGDLIVPKISLMSCLVPLEIDSVK